MKHGLSVVADLTGGDAEMQRAVQEVIKAFGGLDIIVNRCALHACVHAAPPSAGACPAFPQSQPECSCSLLLSYTVLSMASHSLAV